MSISINYTGHDIYRLEGIPGVGSMTFEPYEDTKDYAQGMVVAWTAWLDFLKSEEARDRVA